MAAPNGEAAVRPARGGLRPVAGDAPRGADGPTVGAVAPRWALWLAGSSLQRWRLAAFGVRQPATCNAAPYRSSGVFADGGAGYLLRLAGSFHEWWWWWSTFLDLQGMAVACCLGVGLS
jgi:hypothetical protein